MGYSVAVRKKAKAKAKPSSAPTGEASSSADQFLIICAKAQLQEHSGTATKKQWNPPVEEKFAVRTKFTREEFVKAAQPTLSREHVGTVSISLLNGEMMFGSIRFNECPHEQYLNRPSSWKFQERPQDILRTMWMFHQADSDQSQKASRCCPAC